VEEVPLSIVKTTYKRLLIVLIVVVILGLIALGIVIWNINDAFKNWGH
jgi:uncharacterized membrane protein affecting hemolysin expression